MNSIQQVVLPRLGVRKHTTRWITFFFEYPTEIPKYLEVKCRREMGVSTRSSLLKKIEILWIH